MSLKTRSSVCNLQSTWSAYLQIAQRAQKLSSALSHHVAVHVVAEQHVRVQCVVRSSCCLARVRAGCRCSVLDSPRVQRVVRSSCCPVTICRIQCEKDLVSIMLSQNFVASSAREIPSPVGCHNTRVRAHCKCSVLASPPSITTCSRVISCPLCVQQQWQVGQSNGGSFE